MWTALRPLMRRLLGVARTPTYYLPWLGRPGLECVLLLSNVESRFSPEFNRGLFAVTVTQYGADAQHRSALRRVPRRLRRGRGAATGIRAGGCGLRGRRESGSNQTST
jgi:hypothetical protein